MGIDISADGSVQFNANHERRLNTSVIKNPTLSIIGGLKIQSVFRRVRSEEDKRDGNPFIYALKNSNGYTIDRRHLWLFRPAFLEILSKAVNSVQADIVVPMPSGHKIAFYLACRIAALHPDRPAVMSILQKRTVGNMLGEYEGNIPAANKTIQREFKAHLNKWKKMPEGTLVSMKDVNNRIRPFFSPLCLSSDDIDIGGRSVLLVDDLLSTGSTLKSAQALFNAKGCVAASGLCLLSGL